jgi:penicillin amidase
VRRFGHILLALLIVVLVVALSGAGYVRAQLRSSLPQLEGTAMLAGLSAPVTVTRDSLGVPTITGASHQDVARALGFLHAQDRFFQMDLQRRQPAGELGALVGARAFEVDAENRVHRFRHVARDAYARAEPEWKAMLDAYAAGANAGLQALEAPPFEYLLLRATPDPWLPEDSLLMVHAMFISLQGRQAVFEQTNQQLRDALPDPLFRFLTVVGSEWDAPVSGHAMQRRPVPGVEIANLRGRASAHAANTAERWDDRASCRGEPRWRSNSLPETPQQSNCRATAVRHDSTDEAGIIGSNNWAVDAAHSASGHAMVANDMHLNLGVPNIWYRASMAFPDPSEPLKTLRLAGVTLPGLPVTVVGSNGYVAWGFTNTGGDWSDLVRIEPDPRDPSRYLTPEGPRLFDIGEEAVAIKGDAPRQVTLRGTIWGPIVWKDAAGREYAQRWLAHDPTLLATDLARPERTRTVEETMAAFAGLGLPNQNVTMADVTGRVAWTIGGAMPRRRGLDGFTPESWADGSRGWDGYLEPADTPRIVEPESGRIWTANAPVVSGARLAAIGDGGYADGIRARIIRDRLMKEPKVTPQQMLELQLDDTALFLERWRAVALDVLDTPNARSPADRQPSRAEFRRLVASTWTGRASPDSVAYRLVRTFRQHVVRRVLAFVTAPALERDPSFDFTRSLRTEGPVWALVAERPLHLLDPQFDSWNDLLISAIDAAIAELTEGGRTLEGRTWGEFNRALIQHPLGAAVPVVHRWLNMPDDPLPGDVYTPRAHSPRAGPSERMVVSPGHEEDGILHMPTGQSAHPLSPYFGTMQRAWVDGTPVPFLPGRTEHTLTLKSEKREEKSEKRK